MYHFYDCMKHFYPDVNSLFQDDNTPKGLHRARGLIEFDDLMNIEMMYIICNGLLNYQILNQQNTYGEFWAVLDST